MKHALLATATLLLAACTAADSRVGAAVRDSAGVRITELSVPVNEGGAVWTVAVPPTLSIGVQQGAAAYELDDVRGATRLPDGGIVVANAGSGELRVFDAAGTFIRAIGTAGDGPGEFGAIAWLQRVGPDTLIVLDQDLRRVAAFTPDGTLRSETIVQGGGAPWPGDVRLADGSMLLFWETGDVWERIRTGEVTGGTTDRNTVVVARYTPDGALLDTIGRFAGTEEAILVREGRPATTFPPWGRLFTHSIAGDRVFVGTQERGELRALEADGRVAEIIRWPTGDLTITAADIDLFNETMIEISGGGEEVRQQIIERSQLVPRPDGKPAYGRVLVDARGLLWISEPSTMLVSPERWSVVEPGAGVVAQVTLPASFRLLEVGDDYVLGARTDELGVQTVQVLALAR